MSRGRKQFFESDLEIFFSKCSTDEDSSSDDEYLEASFSGHPVPLQRNNSDSNCFDVSQPSTSKGLSAPVEEESDSDLNYFDVSLPSASQEDISTIHGISGHIKLGITLSESSCLDISHPLISKALSSDTIPMRHSTSTGKKQTGSSASGIRKRQGVKQTLSSKKSRISADRNEWITDVFIPPKVNDFTGPYGIQCALDNTATPVDCFRQFFDDELIEIIVTETNRYANDLLATKILLPQSRLNEWKNTTCTEILEFIALIILMGIIKKPLSQCTLAKTSSTKPLSLELRRRKIDFYCCCQICIFRITTTKKTTIDSIRLDQSVTNSYRNSEKIIYPKSIFASMNRLCSGKADWALGNISQQNVLDLVCHPYPNLEIQLILIFKFYEKLNFSNDER